MDFGRTAFTDVTQPRPSAVPLDALLALSNDGFAFVSADARIVSWSEGAAALSGIPSERALDADVRSLFAGGESVVATPFDGVARDVRIGVETATGTQWLRAVVVAVDLDAHHYGWLFSFGPERRYREIEQLKNEIVAAVSHELKTPIASIKAYATTLRENPEGTAPQQEDFLRVIEDQADRLTRAVDDLLVASRVDVEQLLKRRVTVALDEVVDGALRALSFDERAHPLVRRTQGLSLNGDPELLHEIFFQLLDNARKFSSPGAPVGIEGEMRRHETVVRVRDAGIGIAEEDLPYVFERFYRVESESTAQTGGTGLGLFIVHGLVRAHGGTIAVTSRPGKGSTFTLTLPVRES
ncbi:MAG TPA: HAMP domain-containing sensor histidine kinase [Candidatus Acidoferrales bacterium]|nr:HAMP domain-containing sensor histidine kinase [Candidatus Acidoferrales bacterium]